MDETHDPARQSWVGSAHGHGDFPIQNLPFGMVDPGDGDLRAGVAIGDEILDLRAAAAAGLIGGAAAATLSGTTLNALLGLPNATRVDLRRRLSMLLSRIEHRAQVAPMLRPAIDCGLHMPAAVGDYSDFYVGIHHARNVGALFRPDQPLLPNYKHVPIGYHGRSSSLRLSGVPVVRPNGQFKLPGHEEPVFGPTERLDYELELGLWIGPGNPLGTTIPIHEAAEHVAGFCLLNDWSARDIQAWEYQPLGPFLAKNFQSTISPWIVTSQALAPFRIAQAPRPDGDPRPLSYLWDDADQADGALSITLETSISSAAMRARSMPPTRLSLGSASAMYWTVAQLVAHHASNGCNLAPGDLLGTGTISMANAEGFGSLLELTRGGARPLTLPSGESRRFLEEGDEVILSARAHGEGAVSIGFGACRATILPAAAVP